jgi:SAM-dependent methyltransferase
MSSEHRFGYEWDTYSYMYPAYRAQFINWIGPLTPKDFNGKSVLDAGCGMGRNSFWALKFGADRLVAFDYDMRSVDRTKRNLAEFKNAEVIYNSIYEIPWEREFDIAFSIGVIHHLKDPKRGVINLVRSLKPGGTLFLWVYSYKGAEWIVHYIDPIRKNITSWLPVGVVHVLSYACSVPLWTFIKLTGGMKSAYLRQLAGFTFLHVHSIVFDQLIPDVANYWKKEEVQELLAGLPLTNVYIEPPANGNGWTVVCKKIK